MNALPSRRSRPQCRHARPDSRNQVRNPCYIPLRPKPYETQPLGTRTKDSQPTYWGRLDRLVPKERTPLHYNHPTSSRRETQETSTDDIAKHVVNQQARLIADIGGSIQDDHGTQNQTRFTRGGGYE